MKVIFITGATRGIGYAAAVQAAKQHWTVILNGRDEARLTQIKEQLEMEYQATVYTLSYDVRDIEAIKETFRWIKKNVGHLDAMVNNAGILDDALLGMVNQEQVSLTLAVNTEDAVCCTLNDETTTRFDC